MTATPVSRRVWVAGAVGAAAAAGGFGWLRHSSSAPPREQSEAEKSFWQQQYVQTDGVALAMKSFQGRPLVLNFWATWCPPCIAELPLLDAFFKENKSKSWQVLGLAVDQQEPVKRFLSRTPLAFSIALAGMDGAELSRSLGNLTGGLPFTAVFDPSGAVVHRKLGRLTSADVAGFSQLLV